MRTLSVALPLLAVLAIASRPLCAGELLLAVQLSSHCTLEIDQVQDERPACWRHRCTNKPIRRLGCDLSAMHLINHAVVSADQAQLAILSVGEGHPIVEIVALKPLLQHGAFEVMCSINPYPGTVNLLAWQANNLLIAADVDLTLASSEQRVNRMGEYRYRVRPKDCRIVPTK